MGVSIHSSDNAYLVRAYAKPTDRSGPLCCHNNASFGARNKNKKALALGMSNTGRIRLGLERICSVSDDGIGQHASISTDIT